MTSTNGTAAPDDRAAGRAAAPTWAWSAMLVTGAVWLAFAWTVLRVEPPDTAWWAGAAVLFGAASEVVRAFAGGRMWAMNGCLAVLFAVTAAVILSNGDGALTTPAALIGWYLLVRGAADIVIATGSRATDGAWALTLIVGVAEVGLGFWSSSSLARTADVVIVLIGALALARGLADLTSSYGLFAVAPARSAIWAGRSAAKPAAAQPLPAAGRSAGYAAGLADFTASARSGRARHRATGDEPVTIGADAPQDAPASTTDPEAVLATAGASGAVLATAGVGGGALGSTAQLGTGFGSSVTPSSAVPGAGAAARPPTMFTAPDVSPDAGVSGGYPVPMGPPAGASVDGVFAGAAPATQGNPARSSPGAAAEIVE